MAHGEKHRISIDKEDYFHFHHACNYIVGDDREFLLHHHPHHEVYIYLSGKAEFLFEGSSFRLNPYDIIVVPPYTLHQPQPYGGEIFERLVINVFPNFFQHMDCPGYQDVFFNRADFKYKIPGHIVKRTNIVDFIDFFKEKYDKNAAYMEPLVSCKIVELLYYLNTIDNFEKCDSVNKVTQELIAYIDENFKTISDVQSVTDNFYYSKNHLGHLFKKSTGITLTRYINIKKMENVEKLCKQGKSLLHSCIESGFKSYDSFAYIYKKEFGVSPKKGLLHSIEGARKNNEE
ncbi:MAG: helix-turn-helix domain-containing protein [Clostridia bacterium]|nr:helix-turn-helix domain-containing protein [Clostridia bacterium]